MRSSLLLSFAFQFGLISLVSAQALTPAPVSPYQGPNFAVRQYRRQSILYDIWKSATACILPVTNQFHLISSDFVVIVFIVIFAIIFFVVIFVIRVFIVVLVTLFNFVDVIVNILVSIFVPRFIFVFIDIFILDVLSIYVSVFVTILC
ncbi:hypothetical protein CGMCC3_g8290 [Colletotrichum fructicola]|uniref:Uncharacterized protein n=1 Tax=Colletotrichum fructicola (strain Nara gc5) TaxID=1213859 RepID=L2FYC5_COLFN|nr:uncharacterized protein CGMCC3_g8290 [Colletotrichum fructicola]KAE9575703.1 hypothetical protein CGMCC3_g8290 [Colletotrichum fructicola]KAF4411595.1 hypothetical protein CFRS1_v006436 [Colletotrichum fructicola]KAF5499825.1 hypothetical protein CGCF413_v006538 [Colletotrichum fructicola]